MSRFASEALGKQDRAGFTSGNERIDTYFRNIVTQDIKRRYAACYVLTDQESGQIAGFYTLSSHTIALTALPPETARKLPRYPSVPAVLIGWMGRDIKFRGQQVGPLLLADAIHRLIHSPVGAHAICADAIDEAAARFYREHQFMPLVSRPLSLFLTMKTAQALFEPT